MTLKPKQMKKLLCNNILTVSLRAVPSTLSDLDITFMLLNPKDFEPKDLLKEEISTHYRPQMKFGAR